MDDNSLLMIILAFILGCMCSGMMEQMCGGQPLVEGLICTDYDCSPNETCNLFFGGHCVPKLTCNKKIPSIGCYSDKDGVTPKDTNKETIDVFTNFQADIERSTDMDKNENGICKCPADTGTSMTGQCGTIGTNDYGCICDVPYTEPWTKCTQPLTQAKVNELKK